MKDYSKVVYNGSVFPDSPIVNTNKVVLNNTIETEYLPALKQVLPNGPKGLALLITAMAQQEGFRKGDNIPYKTNNPGNIGNDDSGNKRYIKTLQEGIQLQANEISRIANNGHKAYKIGGNYNIVPFKIPFASKMGLPDWAPGYKFTYTGQLDQFIKIYSTGARVTNAYLNTIISYFKFNGLNITPESKLADIIKMN